MKIFVLTFFVAVVGAFAASAQRDTRIHEAGVLSVVNNDTVNAADVEKTFKLMAPTSPGDNGLPRFAIVGKNHSYYLGIGAQFLGEGVYDMGCDIGSNLLFAPSAFTAATAGNGAGVGFGWQSSSVYLNFVAMPHTDNQVGLFFKANFTGSGNSFNCYHFYAKYRGLTVGYTSGLFTDGAAEPMTIDFEGPNGYPYTTQFTAYWTQKFSTHLSGAIGIDAPAYSFTPNSFTEAVKARIPAVPLYVQYAWAGGGSHVRLSGLVRPMQYRDLTAGKNQTLTGMGIQLSAMTAVAGPVSVQFNAAYGCGIGSYIQDDEGLGLDAVAVVGDAGKMEMAETMGLTAGVTFALAPRLSSNLVYSRVTNWLPEGAEVTANQYRYGDYVAANVIYSINKFVSAGVEYDYGHRKSVGGNSLHAGRIQAQIAVTF